MEMALARDAGDPDGDGSEILWMDIAEEDLDKDDRDPEADLLGGSWGGKPEAFCICGNPYAMGDDRAESVMADDARCDGGWKRP